MSSHSPGARQQTSLLGALEATGNLIAQACLIVAAISLFGIVGINGANVFFRFFLNFAWSWAEEAMLFLMILGVFAGAITAMWRGAHMKLEFLVERLPRPAQRVAVTFIALFSVGILITLSLSSYQVVSLLYRFGQKSAALEFPMWMPQGCVLVGLVAMALMILLRLATYGARPSKSEFDELSEDRP